MYISPSFHKQVLVALNYKQFTILASVFVLSLPLFSQRKLYYFSGSDWCVSCIKFKKEVIESNKFRGFIKRSEIDFEILDFPQRKKGLTKSYINHCDSLASLYNKEGSFPKLVSVDSGEAFTHNLKKAIPFLLAEIDSIFSPLINKIQSSKKIMGSRFKFTIKNRADSSIIFQEGWSLIEKIEKEISSWDSLSLTSKINRNAGLSPLKVPIEFFKLVEYCKNTSEITQGAFDITVKPAVKIWDWKKSTVPSEESVDSVLSIVGSKYIQLNESDTTVFLKKKGVELDFGAVGKGYAADKVIQMWENEFNLNYGVVDAGGDIVAIENEDKLHVIIPNPENPNGVKYEIGVSANAVVTSGDYFRSFQIENKKYSHIINPKTCKPVESSVSSVTVIAPNGLMGDALATAITVLGEVVGIGLINQLPDVEAIINKTDGSEFFSEGIITTYE